MFIIVFTELVTIKLKTNNLYIGVQHERNSHARACNDPNQ